MRILRRINWILAVVTWGLAVLGSLSNLFAWESAWMFGCMTWTVFAKPSALISVSTLVAAFFENDPAEKKSSILNSVIVIAISVLVAILMIFVFSTWLGFGELSGEC